MKQEVISRGEAEKEIKRCGLAVIECSSSPPEQLPSIDLKNLRDFIMLALLYKVKIVFKYSENGVAEFFFIKDRILYSFSSYNIEIVEE